MGGLSAMPPKRRPAPGEVPDSLPRDDRGSAVSPDAVGPSESSRREPSRREPPDSVPRDEEEDVERQAP